MGSSASKHFEIPKYFLFSEGGIYSGSLDSRGFNYKVIPVRPKEEEHELKAYVWSGRQCIDKAENVTEKHFPLTEEGYREMLSWLESECLAMPETGSDIDRQRKRGQELAERYVDLEDCLNHQSSGQ